MHFIRTFSIWRLLFFLFVIVGSIMVLLEFVEDHRMQNKYEPIGREYLLRLIEMDSPRFNASLWLCPHGKRGPMSPSQVSNVYAKHNLNARCVKPLEKCSAIKSAMEVFDKMREMHRNRIDDRMPIGPFLDSHPRQDDYCQMTMEMHCDEKLPACRIQGGLTHYAQKLIRETFCPRSYLMGAAGPPAKLDAHQCDVYFDNK